jgi:hypothetical protein
VTEVLPGTSKGARRESAKIIRRVGRSRENDKPKQVEFKCLSDPTLNQLQHRKASITTEPPTDTHDFNGLNRRELIFAGSVLTASILLTA